MQYKLHIRAIATKTEKRNLAFGINRFADISKDKIMITADEFPARDGNYAIIIKAEAESNILLKDLEYIIAQAVGGEFYTKENAV
jgi:hypothetical protein